MSSSSFHIRAATPQDVGAILQLIIDLATYEKAADSVKATPELVSAYPAMPRVVAFLTLRKNLFETPFAHALLAFAGTVDNPGKAVGLALYFFNYSTWTGRPGLYLEDLYVSPECRNLGIGKALFGELGKVAKEKLSLLLKAEDLFFGFRKPYYLVTTFPCTDWPIELRSVGLVCLKWNQPSIDFYEKKLGATPMSEWMGMRLEEEGIDKLSSFVLEAAPPNASA
ncbi:Peroxygenase 1 [Paramarasmius palmivorus]|uniref:Peroxygenase 1 n=1 Tax=Paramarasmius palmivorus TaxID=297713 RepID=A0AAW0D709_9AGAR